MSFFNPFRKNQRPEGVKLATMQTPEEAGTAAPHAEPTFGARTEPSLGRFNEGTQTGGQTAPSAQPTEPPPFDFAEPAAQTAGEQIAPPQSSQAPQAPQPPERQAAAPAAPKAAPWDPYGIHAPTTDKNEPQWGTSAESVSAPEAAQILAPEAAGAPAAQAPFVMPEPRQEPDPLPAAAAETEEAEALKPALKPVPREQVRAQAERERAAERPARRPLTDAELLARRRTKHRMVGAAVLLMAAVVAAPFVIDNEPPIDTSKLESTDLNIPKESETSTTLNVPPAAHGDRAQAGDVDVSDTSMGRAESTAKANLEREAKGAAEAAPKQPGKTAAPAQAAKSEKAEKTPAKPADRTAAKPDPKAQKPAQKPQPAAKSAGIAPPTGKGWYVQVVATSNEAAAERTVKKLAHLGLPAYRTNEGGALWKVRVGLYAEKSEAEGVRGTIMLNGIAQKPYLAKKD